MCTSSTLRYPVSLYNDVLRLNNSKHHPCYKSTADQNSLSDVIFFIQGKFGKIKNCFFFGCTVETLPT